MVRADRVADVCRIYCFFWPDSSLRVSASVQQVDEEVWGGVERDIVVAEEKVNMNTKDEIYDPVAGSL